MRARLQSPGPSQSAGALSQHRCQLVLLLGAALVLFFFTVSVKVSRSFRLPPRFSRFPPAGTAACLLFALHVTPPAPFRQLPRHTLLLEEELEDLVVSHLHHNPHAFCHCPGEDGPGGAPRFCRLGLPPNASAGTNTADSGSEGGDGRQPDQGGSNGVTAQQQEWQQGEDQHAQSGSESEGAAARQGSDAVALAAALPQRAPPAAQQAQQGHRLAVLVPYRDRQQHLEALLAALRPFLERQGRAHDVFVVEQASRRPACHIPPRSAAGRLTGRACEEHANCRASGA